MKLHNPFTNIRAYRIDSKQFFDTSRIELEDRLAKHPARPCGPLEPAAEGWEAPIPADGSGLVHSASGRMLICLRREEKILPASVVREQAEARAAEIAAGEGGRKIGRKERAQLREDILQELLPRALTRSSRTFAYLDPEGGWLVVGAAGAKRAESVVTALRRAIGSLPVTPIRTQLTPATVMTWWLTERPADIALQGDAWFQDTADKATKITARNEDMASVCIGAIAGSCKKVVKISIIWRDRLSFRLSDDLSIQRLRMTDIAREAADDEQVGRVDSDFVLWSAEIAGLLAGIVQHFGGYEA